MFVEKAESISGMDLQNFLWKFEQANKNNYDPVSRWLATKTKQWHGVVQHSSWRELPEPSRSEFATFRLAEIAAARKKLAEQDAELEAEAQKLTVDK